MTQTCTKTQVENCQWLDIKEHIKNMQNKHVFFVVDRAVYELYKEEFYLPENRLWLLEDPEENKSIECYQRCCSDLVSMGIKRNSILVAIGGGATSDFTGFVAATLFRGISWEVIPTTLLAQVDACIGGKVGLNTPYGKNMLGSFHLPKKVYICPDFLKTLPRVEYYSGLGEVIKYLYLSDECYRRFLHKGMGQELISQCINYKNNLVEEDFKEVQKRMCLNLGHTLGHAYEKCSSLAHGLCVIKGIKKIGQAYFNDELEKKWRKIILTLDLLEVEKQLDRLEVNHTQFWEYVGRDKKSGQDYIDIIIIDNQTPKVLKSSLNELQKRIVP